MVVETDDKEERTQEGESGETPSADGALIGWLGAIHAEIRALSARVGRIEERVSHVETQVARIETGIETERQSKNRTAMWVGIGVGVLGALVGIGGVVLGVISLLN